MSSLEDMYALVGGWNGNNLWGMDNDRLDNNDNSNLPLVIIDGAHNAEAAYATVNAYMRRVRRQCHVIFSCFRDKNLGALLAQFGSIPGELTLTTFPHPRARTEDEFFLFLDEYTFQEDAIALIKQKMEEFPEDVILVCGSLAFAAYIRKEVFNDK